MSLELARQKLSVIVWAAAAWIVVSGIAAVPQKPASGFTLPENQQFTNTGQQLLASSPDGGQFVYIANNRLYRKVIGNPQPSPIPGTETPRGLTNPAFSPDGRSIAFWSGADQTLKRIPTDGGPAVTICKTESPVGMSWGPGDQIVFGQFGRTRAIMRVSANGGVPETVVTAQGNEVVYDPQVLPEGDFILFTLAT